MTLGCCCCCAGKGGERITRGCCCCIAIAGPVGAEACSCWASRAGTSGGASTTAAGAFGLGGGVRANLRVVIVCGCGGG